MGEEAKDYELMGFPSAELDTAWENLMGDFFTEVPYSYVAKVGRLDEGIPTASGGFLATYSFMHQLHCLKRVHHSYWPERYYPNTTEQDKANLLEHNHPVPETLRWVEQSRFPLGNRTSPHECVNWDALMSEMKKHRVDPFKPGVLVHPKFGPVVPDGRNTVIDESERHRFVINGTSLHTSDGRV
ncbi:hypothetical protein DM02DRAFT_691275 [Periconia macrospinosa]|uniref:Uncharacterized protein n=1 Tax=Periconia macrospinosa TaxID=97972 RepID=A0A2V1DAV8_9PLEO|nr:hypothetical protein DM02DRAFT_691275 [Periconia macrospinosa]